jgi:protein TonB
MNRHHAARGVTSLLGVLALCLPLLAGAAEKPVKGDPPEYPREAERAGYSEGRLKVKLSVGASGEVNRVEVVEANPRRVFDRATVRALSEWKYAPGAARTIELELEFRR